jgi:hypothetical protein
MNLKSLNEWMTAISVVLVPVALVIVLGFLVQLVTPVIEQVKP